MIKYEMIIVNADGEENEGASYDNMEELLKGMHDAFDDGKAVYVDRYEVKEVEDF